MTEPATRVALFGMRCGFTTTVLDALAASPAVELRGIVLPGDASAGPGDAFHDIPVVPAPGRSSLATPEFRAALAALAPDGVVVACFPWRLPAAVRAIPARGCLNIHPSLLPDGRGPEPVFWTFRRDEREAGVTLHRLDGGLDTGPILARDRLAIPDGATIGSLERQLAHLGVGSLLRHLPALRDGTAVFMPQGDPAWDAPHPRPGDLLVPTGWSAGRAARFIGAVAGAWGPLPVLVEATGQRLAVEAVIAREPREAGSAPLRIDGNMARIRFTDGVLACRLAIERHRLTIA